MPDQLGDLVPVEWEARSEAADAPSPNPTVQALPPGTGVVIEGTLDGTGWNDVLPERVWSSPICDGDTGGLPLGIDGDWTGDVDSLGIEIVQPSQLCAQVQGAGPETGWDLVLVAVDGCVLPERVVQGEDGPIGLGLGGDDAGWTTRVEPGFYQISLAAYDPVDPEQQVSYRLLLSALEASDESLGLCSAGPRETP